MIFATPLLLNNMPKDSQCVLWHVSFLLTSSLSAYKISMIIVSI